MKKVFTLFADSPKRLLIEFIIFTLLISIFDLGGVYILGSVMTNIFSPEFSSAGGLIEVGSYLMSYQIIAAIFLTRMFSIAFCNFLLGRTIFKIAGNYSSQIFNKSIVNSPYRQHASFDDKSAVIAVDTNVVLNTFLIPLCRLVTEVLVIVGIFSFLATVSLKITIVAIFSGILSISVLQISLGYISAKLGLLRQIAEKNRIEGIQRAADFNLLIDVYNLKNWLAGYFNQANSSVTNTGARQFFIMSLPKYFYETLFILCLVFSLSFSDIDLSSSYLIIILVARLIPALNGVSTCWASFSTSIAASAKINDVIHSPSSPNTSILEPESNKDNFIKKRSGELNAEVAWSKYHSFPESFPPTNPFGWDISLKLTKGDLISIRGPSGVGKSTLLKSIIGQFSVPSSILLNNKKCSIFDSEWLKLFAYVPQDSFVYAGSIRDNILLGRDFDENLMQKSITESKLFDMGDITRDLNLDSYLSPSTSSLSGGQLQRLSLARALYSNSKILLLDEFTSALDEETEDLIMATINKLSKNLVIVGVSHRPAYNSIANKIIDFKKGMPAWN